MIKLLEKELYLKCRKEDVQLVQSILQECEKEYSEIMMKETNEEYKTKLTLVDGEYLTAEHGGECGGIVMFTTDKRIVCKNTLKSRLDLCFEELLPHIRKILFPPKKVAATK
jgi:V-type H+-transporting ATPase subunit E